MAPTPHGVVMMMMELGGRSESKLSSRLPAFLWAADSAPAREIREILGCTH